MRRGGVGRPGADKIVESAFGDDTIKASNGNDPVFGGAGDDVIEGGRWQGHPGRRLGDDTLFGGSGKDRLRGGSGNDRLEPGFGSRGEVVNSPRPRSSPAPATRRSLGNPQGGPRPGL